jgi:hypothetical protein
VSVAPLDPLAVPEAVTVAAAEEAGMGDESDAEELPRCELSHEPPMSTIARMTITPASMLIHTRRPRRVCLLCLPATVPPLFRDGHLSPLELTIHQVSTPCAIVRERSLPCFRRVSGRTLTKVMGTQLRRGLDSEGHDLITE